jgi:hypothetical protein
MKISLSPIHYRNQLVTASWALDEVQNMELPVLKYVQSLDVMSPLREVNKINV